MTLAQVGDPELASSRAEAAPLDVPRVAPLDRRIGALAFFRRLLRNPLRVLPAAAYEEGIVVAERAGRTVCWITDASLIRAVLLEGRETFGRTPITQRILGPLLGAGVLTADGSAWKWQRQTVAPVFRHADLLAFVPTIGACAAGLLAEWGRGRPDSVRAIDADMTAVTFDVIAHTLLPGGDTHVAPLIGDSGFDYQKPLGWQLAYANFGLPSWMPHPGMLMMRIAQRELRKAVADLVAERRAKPAGRDDLLQRLMQAKNPETGAGMSDDLLVDNLLTFFMAGHETTAKALTWTLYLLARAPAWQARLAQEIGDVAGRGPILSDHIDRLTLTTQVIKESMRLFPPAPIISRQANQETRLGDVRIPAGAQIIIPIYAIQRHRRYWSDPDRFDPARFAPENEAKISRYHYMPFGAGARICVGMAFAMIEAVAILATLVRAARFTAIPGREPEPISRVTLRPAGGMPLGVALR
jgi:cytochrome P450